MLSISEAYPKPEHFVPDSNSGAEFYRYHEGFTTQQKIFQFNTNSGWITDVRENFYLPTGKEPNPGKPWESFELFESQVNLGFVKLDPYGVLKQPEIAKATDSLLNCSVFLVTPDEISLEILGRDVFVLKDGPDRTIKAEQQDGPFGDYQTLHSPGKGSRPGSFHIMLDYDLDIGSEGSQLGLSFMIGSFYTPVHAEKLLVPSGNGNRIVSHEDARKAFMPFAIVVPPYVNIPPPAGAFA